MVKYEKSVDLTWLLQLATALQSCKRRANELGMFTDDRELFECAACSLKEDVTGHGLLITYKNDAIGIDTGIRFDEPDDDGVSICPCCGRRVQGEWL